MFYMVFLMKKTPTQPSALLPVDRRVSVLSAGHCLYIFILKTVHYVVRLKGKPTESLFYESFSYTLSALFHEKIVQKNRLCMFFNHPF